MRKKKLPHIITVVSFVVFIVLGSACASSSPAESGSQSGTQRSSQPELSAASDYWQRGIMNFKNGNHDLAVEDFSEVIRRSPDSAPAYNARARAYGYLENLDQALTDINQALKLNQNNAHNADYLDTRGWVYLNKGDYDRAIDDFETALKLEPNMDTSIEGIALARQGKVNAQESVAIEQQKQIKASYFTGDGGKTISLGIGTPKSQGLNADLVYIPTLVQGVLVDSISKYSEIKVLDRVSLDRVIAETLDPTFTDNLDIVRLGHVTQCENWLTGNIIKTSTGYTLQLNITDTTPEAKTIASYTGTCTIAEFDNHSAIHKAALALLDGMGITLTDKGKAELAQASNQQYVAAQTALSQGIVAQRKGTEVTALVYLNQAAAIDPSFVPEVASRSKIISASITSGNISSDARNDIAWRKQWVDRLTETEELFYKMFSNRGLPYSLFYSNGIQQGKINYQSETIDLGISLNLRMNNDWINTLEIALQTVKAMDDDLQRTRRRKDWGFDDWPNVGVSKTNPFGTTFFGGSIDNVRRRGTKWTTDFTIVFEILNNNNRVIGSQTITLSPYFEIYCYNRTAYGRFMEYGTPGTAVGESDRGIKLVNEIDNVKNISFSGVKVTDTSDVMTIRIASVNGEKPENAQMQIIPLSESEWTSNDWKVKEPMTFYFR